MPARRTLLNGSAAGAGRMIAAAQLEAWLKAQRKLASRRTATALHDFRVALRRLRSTLRAFRPYLVHPKGQRRRLRRLARSTNEGRNLEIWIAWVAAHSHELPAAQRIGVRWLRARLAARRRLADELMRQRLANWLPRLRGELKEVSKRLVRRTPDRHVPPGAGPAIAAVLRRETRVLMLQLKSVVSMKDRYAAHSARIAGKRLRYLLEPLRGELPGATTAVRELERLQDLLGEVHDAHVFADELRSALVEATEQRSRAASERLLPWPGPGASLGRPAPAKSRAGLLALARQLRKDGDMRFARLRRWLSGGGDELARALDRLARRCAVGNRGGRI